MDDEELRPRTMSLDEFHLAPDGAVEVAACESEPPRHGRMSLDDLPPAHGEFDGAAREPAGQGRDGDDGGNSPRGDESPRGDDSPQGGDSPRDDDSDDGSCFGNVDMLARRLDEMRDAGQLPAHLVDPPPRAPLLDSFDVQGVARCILATSGADVVVLGGAGMSTSAGIPDFRSPGTGLYDNLQKYDLPRPQAVFEIEYFRESPTAFYELVRELWPGAFSKAEAPFECGLGTKYKPTATHLFIRLLEDKGRLLRCFTQNIDSLEACAGVPPDRVVAAHGNFDSATCIDTGEKVDVVEVRDAVLAGEWEALRSKYGGLVKPDIVFFGEGLPKRFFDLAQHDLPRATVCLVVGTSLAVQPFASLVNHVGEDCVRVLVNRDAVALRDSRIPQCIAMQLGMGGFEFFNEQNYRDVALLGNCDDRILELVEALGWMDDFKVLLAHFGHALPPDVSARAVAPPHVEADEADDVNFGCLSVTPPTAPGAAPPIPPFDIDAEL